MSPSSFCSRIWTKLVLCRQLQLLQAEEYIGPVMFKKYFSLRSCPTSSSYSLPIFSSIMLPDLRRKGWYICPLHCHFFPFFDFLISFYIATFQTESWFLKKILINLDLNSKFLVHSKRSEHIRLEYKEKMFICHFQWHLYRWGLKKRNRLGRLQWKEDIWK